MVKQTVREAWRTLVPAADDPYGPLPRLLVILTAVSGLVDAYSYLEFHRVFLANITGNIVFLGISISGAGGLLWWTSLLAIIAFLVGARAAGHVRSARGGHLARHLSTAASIETVAVAVATAVAATNPDPGYPAMAVIIVIIGVAMGFQNATARSLNISGLNTTVLTISLSDMAAESVHSGGAGSRAGRRLIAVAAMVLGAAVGALLATHAIPVLCLAVCVVLLAGVAVVAGRRRNTTAPWAVQ